jgi:hypothetical protein
MTQAARPVRQVQIPTPQALNSTFGVRRELNRLYREAKSGLIEPALLGRLCHILTSMLSCDRDQALDERLLALEQAAGIATPGRTNGAAHDARH